MHNPISTSIFFSDHDFYIMQTENLLLQDLTWNAFIRKCMKLVQNMSHASMRSELWVNTTSKYYKDYKTSWLSEEY